MPKKHFMVMCLEFPDDAADETANNVVENFMDTVDSVASLAGLRLGFSIAPAEANHYLSKMMDD